MTPALPDQFVRKVAGTRYQAPDRLGVAGFHERNMSLKVS